MTKAPDFTLLNQDNEKVSLSDFAGKRVLLFFFPKANTPGCTAQACGFRDHFPEITEHNATVIGMSADTPAELKKWKDQQHLSYTLLSDLDHAVATAYGVWDQKSMFGKKYFGITRSHFVIDEQGNLEIEARKINPFDSVKKGTAALLK